jgi:hypothetical protein
MSVESAKVAENPFPDSGVILVAFEKLFGGGRGVKRFARSHLRYLDLGNETVLIEQNPKKASQWAKLAREGHRVAWVMREGEYLARVIDGVVIFMHSDDSSADSQ